MFTGVEGNKRVNTYANGRVYKRTLGGKAEHHGIKRGQVWEVERYKGKPWRRYVVTCISDCPIRGGEHAVYMHSVKNGRLIVKHAGSLIKGRGCRLVEET